MTEENKPTFQFTWTPLTDEEVKELFYTSRNITPKTEDWDWGPQTQKAWKRVFPYYKKDKPTTEKDCE